MNATRTLLLRKSNMRINANDETPHGWQSYVLEHDNHSQQVKQHKEYPCRLATENSIAKGSYCAVEYVRQHRKLKREKRTEDVLL